MNYTTVVILLCLAIGFVWSQNGQLCSSLPPLSERIMRNVKANNKTIRDSAAYDRDSDGCVSRAEWVYRWVKDFQLTVGYALARLDELVAERVKNPTETCLITFPNGPRNTSIERSTIFINENIGTLVKYCNSDKSLANSNCDCSELPGMCANDDFFKTYEVCVNYNKNVGK